jgi:hypothetical protein
MEELRFMAGLGQSVADLGGEDGGIAVAARAGR